MSYTLNYTGSEIDDILDRAAPGGAIDQALATKQDVLTFDDAPTSGSDNPVKSGGIYDAIQAGGAAALAAFATDSVSGDVVSFPDGADGIPVKSFVGSIIPAQSGSGDPAPDNVRPISGWTGANITRTGRNLFSPHSNHNVNAQGEYIAAGAQYWATDYIPIGDTKSVVVSVADLGGMTEGSIVRVAYASDGTVTSTNIGYFDHYTTPWTFTLADNIVGLRFRGYRQGGASPITGAKIQAEFGSSATTYQPYNGDTILLSFGQTVYAGTLTALGGGLWKIQPTHRIDTLNGSETWTVTGSNQYAYYCTMPTDMPRNKLGRISNMLKFDGYKAASALVEGGFCGNNSSVPSQILCYPSASAFPTADAWKAYLVDHPMQIVSELTTLPDPITITGEDLQTLLGANSIWQSCGSVTELTYRADTALYTDKKLGA